MRLINKTARIISTSLLVAISLSANQIGLAAQSVAQPTPAKVAPVQTVDNLVNNWLKRPELQHSFVGVEILELPSGKELFSYNSRKRFAPASTTKVLTTACAYATLGGAYTYKTRVVADGKIAGDTLSGDLVIIPSQDPSFTRSDLQTMLSPVIKQVHKTSGTLVLDPTPGGFEVFQPSWVIEDFGQDYMPVCSNFIIDRNVAQGLPNLKGIHSVIEGPNEHFNALERSLLNSEVASGWIAYNPAAREITAFIGSGVTAKSPLSVADPDEYNLALASDFLQQIGVKIGRKSTSVIGDALQRGGQRLSGATGGAITVLGEHESKPLSLIIQHCLHESDNLYAQQLVRTLGLPTGKATSNSPTLEDAGIGKITRWLGSIGVPSQEAILFDGCGLSRKNGISPHALNTVLKAMAGPNLDGPYLALLKHSGTSTGKGEFVFKTGSMDTVRSIAGVLQTAGGQHIAVTMIVNDHVQSVKNLRPAFSDLIALLNQITSITIIPPKPGSGDKEEAVIQTTRAVAPSSGVSRHRRRRR